MKTLWCQISLSRKGGPSEPRVTSLLCMGIGLPWSLASDFPVTSVCFPGVCAVNGLLYVVGGDDGSCNLASVEYYNPVTDKWTLLPTNMSTGRSYAGQWVSASGTRRDGSLLSWEPKASCRVSGNCYMVTCPPHCVPMTVVIPSSDPERTLGILNVVFQGHFCLT